VRFVERRVSFSPLGKHVETPGSFLCVSAGWEESQWGVSLGMDVEREKEFFTESLVMLVGRISLCRLDGGGEPGERAA
jgi:hypothetical protein